MCPENTVIICHYQLLHILMLHFKSGIELLILSSSCLLHLLFSSCSARPSPTIKGKFVWRQQSTLQQQMDFSVHLSLLQLWGYAPALCHRSSQSGYGRHLIRRCYHCIGCSLLKHSLSLACQKRIKIRSDEASTLSSVSRKRDFIDSSIIYWSSGSIKSLKGSEISAR